MKGEEIVFKMQEIFKSTYNRDKIGKIIQYGHKAIGWYQKEVLGDEKEAKHSDSVSSQVSLGRKLFRLGRFVHEWDTIHAFLTSTPLNKVTLRDLINLAKLFLTSNYWVFDNLYWLSKVGIYRKGDVERYKKLSILFWFLGAIAGFIQVLLKISKNFADLATAKRKEDMQALHKVESERVDLTANFIKSAGDLFVAFSYSIDVKILPRLFEPNNGAIGVAGVLSALSDLFVIWKGLKKK